jgi:hypothetical protein
MKKLIQGLLSRLSPKPEHVNGAPGDDDEFDQDGPTCTRCDGYGYVDCHCGGDLCVCENYGEKICPKCGGA